MARRSGGGPRFEVLFLAASTGYLRSAVAPAVLQVKNILVLAGWRWRGALGRPLPGFLSDRFRPAGISKGGPGRVRKAAFRRSLVIFQFSISISLMIGIMTVSRQMEYIHGRPLGFHKENVVILP